jgi:DNA-binding XRE family transcriptional regulator
VKEKCEVAMLKAELGFVHYLEDLRETAGLKSVDVANIVDVSEATVSRWGKGMSLPHPKTQLMLSDLHYVVNRLRDSYTRDEARLWLYSRHPQLNGERAVDVIAAGRAEEVLTVIERLDSAAFV